MEIFLEIQKKKGFLYKIIIFLNEICVRTFFKRITITSRNCGGYVLKPMEDPEVLYSFLQTIDIGDYSPHLNDKESVKKIFKLKSFIPLGVFDKDRLVAYVLIRLLFTRLASYFIFVSRDYQKMGIGTNVLRIVLKQIQDFGFFPLSMVDKKNTASIKMLKKINIKFINELKNYYVVGGIK